MIFYAIVWIAWICPGGGWFAPAWPAKLHPLVCTPSPRLELYDPARAAAARRRVVALGAESALYACRGVQCRGPISSWSTVVNFQEAHP